MFLFDRKLCNILGKFVETQYIQYDCNDKRKEELCDKLIHANGTAGYFINQTLGDGSCMCSRSMSYFIVEPEAIVFSLSHL